MMPRERLAIESHCAHIFFLISPVFTLKASNLADRGWRRSAASTLLNYLTSCPYQPEHVKSTALGDPSRSKCIRSGSTRATYLESPSIHRFYSSSIHPRQDRVQFTSLLAPDFIANRITPNLIPSLMSSPLIFSPAITLGPSDSISQAHSGSATDSQGFGLHPSCDSRRLLLRRRTLNNTQYTVWTSDKQQSFEN